MLNFLDVRTTDKASRSSYEKQKRRAFQLGRRRKTKSRRPFGARRFGFIIAKTPKKGTGVFAPFSIKNYFLYQKRLA
jgi:hypothetical protein